MPPRHQTSTQRDLSGLAAKREREAAPEFIEEDLTGQYQGPDLDAARARRPTPERLIRLERKNDMLVAELLEQNKSRRDLMVKIVVGILGLISAYLLGKHG